MKEAKWQGSLWGLDPLSEAQSEMEAIRRLVMRARERLDEADKAWDRVSRGPAGELSKEELSEWEKEELREWEEERARIGEERDLAPRAPAGSHFLLYGV